MNPQDLLRHLSQANTEHDLREGLAEVFGGPTPPSKTEDEEDPDDPA